MLQITPHFLNCNKYELHSYIKQQLIYQSFKVTKNFIMFLFLQENMELKCLKTSNKTLSA